MFIRIVSSAAAGIAVTTGLFFLMQYLIASGEEIIVDPREGSTLDWIALEIEEPLIVDPPVFERPEPPIIPPRSAPPESAGDEIGINPPGPRPPIPAGGPRFKRLNLGDGPLVNIFKVKPQYPIRAAARSIEGTVLVQFDVTTLGTVANVIVIETSSSIFNKAAIDAAYRFKYKPRIVDGVPYESKGLRNLFRFEMEK